jgi:hypothetical protein
MQPQDHGDGHRDEQPDKDDRKSLSAAERPAQRRPGPRAAVLAGGVGLPYWRRALRAARRELPSNRVGLSVP